MMECVSDTGLKVKSSVDTESAKKVGIFYSIWHGAHIDHATGTYDNTKVLENLGPVIGRKGITPEEWMDAGGGSRGKFHWWGEPLFGYYTLTDEWVLDKHVQMLTDAAVDFLVIDFTNGTFPAKDKYKRDASYTERLLLLFKALNKYYKQGKKVPQVVCYTYYKWTKTVYELYHEVYKPHPEYNHLWFRWGNSNKPMIIGNTAGYDSIENDLDNEINDFFDIKDGAFPHETKNPKLIPDIERNNSILWADFRPDPVKVTADNVSYVTISTSEINATNAASEQWFYDSYDRTKSWDGKLNRNWLKGEGDAYLYGYNFERQFRLAIQQDPDVILIAGFNEWIAELQVRKSGYIGFIDMANINNNRDIEPMKGGYGDNYYLQMVKYINEFKNTKKKVIAGGKMSFSVDDSFEKWNEKSVKAIYKDYIGDTIHRNSFEGFDWSKKLLNSSGRNDIDTIKVARDDNYLYFYVSTVDEIVYDQNSFNTMTLFLSTGCNKNWYGYDYVINRIDCMGENLKLEKSLGGWSWVHVSDIKYKLEGNKMMVLIPRKDIDLENKRISIQFKWADKFTSDNIYSFYTDGDAAPYGRLNYVYEEE